jgi:hypothetical protein
MKKPNTTRLKDMARNLKQRIIARQIKNLNRSAMSGDYELLKMHSNDLADVLFICGEILNGNYGTAFDTWGDLDTQIRDIFSIRFINILEKAAEYEYHFNGEQ